ncbi:MAG: replication protein [Dehalococcoidia bacterium]|jgi:phage replication O-like protein O
MANPQTEDGHTKIANDLMGALMRTNFSAYDRRVLDCILRKTYGWNRKTDRISYSQFTEETGINRRHVARSISKLLDRNIITVNGSGYALEYGLQKDFEKWDASLPKEVTNINLQSLPKQVIESLPIQDASLPKEVTNINLQSLPKQVIESLPIQDASLPKEVTKSLPKQVHTKAIKHYTKAILKQGDFSLPDWIDRELWQAFTDMRKKMKAPLTDMASKLIVKDLEKFRAAGDDPNSVIEQSIKRGWRGVFRLKEGDNGKTGRRVEKGYTIEQLEASVGAPLD